MAVSPSVGNEETTTEVYGDRGGGDNAQVDVEVAAFYVARIPNYFSVELRHLDVIPVPMLKALDVCSVHSVLFQDWHCVIATDETVEIYDLHMFLTDESDEYTGAGLVACVPRMGDAMTWEGSTLAMDPGTAFDSSKVFILRAQKPMLISITL